MPETPLNQLSALGQSVWIDFLSRTFFRDGELARASPTRPSSVSPPTRRSSRPRSQRATPTTTSSRVLRRRPKGVFLALAIARRRGACDLLRRAGTPPARRPRRLGLARGRPEPRRRHRGHDRRGQPPARARRPHEPVRQDPGDQGRPAGDRGDDRRWHHINVTLIFSLERHREVIEAYIPGARAPCATRAATRAAGLRCQVLRLARRHRGRQAPRRRRRPRRAQGHARDRQRQARLPDLPGALRGRRWEALRPRAPRRSAACGRRRRRRTPTTAT